MNVKKPNLGPIVGDANSKGTKIFIRGNANENLGIIKYTKGEDKLLETVELRESTDWTGVFNLGELENNKIYEYFTGCIPSIDVDSENLNWDDSFKGYFKTTDSSLLDRNYVVGSCRYISQGNDESRSNGDKIYKNIIDSNSEKKLDGVIMLGDQIYADYLLHLFPAKSLQEYFNVYRFAFESPNMRKLMSMVSTYMILDDHEVLNNWPNKHNSQADRIPNALKAYNIYQCSHSPCRDHNWNLKNRKFWYTFTDGCCDFFVLDARSEREIKLKPDGDYRMLGDEQLMELKEWLNDDSERIKIICSSVPFAPDIDSGEDKWQGFPKQRREILEYIDEHKIKKVVFIGGDLHASASMQLDLGDTLITCIVASRFYWPEPIGSLKKVNMKMSGTLDCGLAGAANIIHSTEVYHDNNYSRIKFSTDKVTVEVFDYDNNKVIECSGEFYFLKKAAAIETTT